MSNELTRERAVAALDLLADLRLRTAPHTSQAQQLNAELRTGFRLKRPADALAAWETALAESSDELHLHRALTEWSLALGLHAAINLQDLKATRRVIDRLAQTLPPFAPRAAATFGWARRARDVTEAMAGLVGRSPVMDALRTQTWRAVFTDDVRKALALKAPHRMSVLITGEPGTGKEIVARTIAAGRGPLAPEGDEPGPYVTLNIASLTAELANSALFGHVRGAYTGAASDRDGLFVAASGGVLFLDEVGDASAEVQVRLLRTLQEGTVRPVGADSERQVEVRVLAASNRDLSATDRDGQPTFRQDLLERLSVLRVACPPLRERLDDLPELVRHFVAEEIDVVAFPTIIDETLQRLLEETGGHRWPGNVRELRACANRVLAGQPAILPEADRTAGGEGGPRIGGPAPSRGGDALEGALLEAFGPRALEDVKRRYAVAVLRQQEGNKSEAARVLGIDRNTLSRYVKQARAEDRRRPEEEE